MRSGVESKGPFSGEIFKRSSILRSCSVRCFSASRDIHAPKLPRAAESRPSCSSTVVSETARISSSSLRAGTDRRAKTPSGSSFYITRVREIGRAHV